jgi:hypothetical protein
MKKLFVITVLCLLGLHTWGQEPHVQPKRKHGQGCKEDLFNVVDKQTKLWGYRNFEGEWIIPASYMKAFEFVAGKAIVQKGAKLGVIDCSGYLIINCEYDDFLEFAGDRVWAKKGNLWGLITDKGQVIYQPAFDELRKIGFENDVIWVRKGDKWGIFSEKTLRFVANPTYSDFTVASDEVSIVVLKDTLGLIDNFSGKYIIEPKITDMEKISSRCFAYKMNGKWGAINHLGEKVIKSDFDLLKKWETSLILAQKKDKYKILNEKGKPFSNTYDYIGPNVNGFGVFKFNGKYGYLNKTGSLLVAPKFDQAGNFFFDRAIVKLANKYQLINAQGKFLSANTYDLVERDSTKKYFVATLAGKKQILDLGGKMVLNELQDVKFHDSETSIRFSKLGKYGVYDLQAGKIFINPEYDEVQFFRFDQFLVKKEGNWGLVDKTGTLKIPVQYESIDYYMVEGKAQYVVAKGEKKGLLNDQNGQIFPLEYELIAPATNKNYVLKKEGKYGVLSIKGEELVPFKYDYISNVVEEPNTPAQPLIYRKGKKAGLLNYKGEELQSLEGNLKYVGESLYAHTEGSSVNLINIKGETQNKEALQEVTTYSEGMIAAKKEGTWGYLARGGKFVIIPVFEEAQPYLNKLATVKKAGKYGMIDMLGREFVPFEYDGYVNKEGKRIFYKGTRAFELTRAGRLKAVE